VLTATSHNVRNNTSESCSKSCVTLFKLVIDCKLHAHRYREVRKTSRRRIVALFTMHGAFLMSYFGNSGSMQATFLVLGVPLLFFLLERVIRDLKTQELLFDLMLCAVTILGALNFSVLAWKEFPDGFDFETLPVQMRGFVQRIQFGQVPPPSLHTLITPLALAPVGFSIRTLKIVTTVHAFIFLSTLIAVYLKTRSEKCLSGSYNVCEANFMHDTSGFVLTIACAFLGHIQGAEIHRQSLSSLRDGRNADSVRE
jgi:hypothetical protein